MALHSTYTIPNIAVSLTASATKTLILITPISVDFVISELCVSMDTGAASTSPEVDLYRVTTIGTPAGTSTTPAKSSGPDSAAAPQTGTNALTNLTAEPTAVTVIKPWFVPQSGLLLIQFPLGRETVGSLTGGAALGLRVITPAGVTPKALAYFEIEI
ncbi:MAG: hypothetical protein JWO67_3188 [Streptosporangiaceae bacterium]|nr:hypothetical protein [Streptosporangiaceae bacterium]